MRYLLLLSVVITNSFWPVVALAQSQPPASSNWQEWVKQNPTYPSLQKSLPATTAPTPAQPKAPAKRSPTWETMTDLPPNFDRDQAIKIIATGCADMGAPRAYCNCFAQQLLSKYSVEEAARIGLQYQQTGSIPPELVRIAEGCLAQ